MSPARLERLLKSGATLGPPAAAAHPAPSAATGPSAGSGSKAAVGSGAGGGAGSSGGPGGGGLFHGLPKEVFFDPVKRAAALRQLQRVQEETSVALKGMVGQVAHLAPSLVPSGKGKPAGAYRSR